MAHLGSTWPPRRLQDAPETAQDASKSPQDAAKMPPRASKTPSRASNTSPRDSKMPPRRLQDVLKTAKDASKSPQVYTFEQLYPVYTSGNQSAKCGRGDPFLCFEMKLSLSGSSFSVSIHFDHLYLVYNSGPPRASRMLPRHAKPLPFSKKSHRCLSAVAKHDGRLPKQWPLTKGGLAVARPRRASSIRQTTLVSHGRVQDRVRAHACRR